jgi:hypothetical protein
LSFLLISSFLSPDKRSELTFKCPPQSLVELVIRIRTVISASFPGTRTGGKHTSLFLDDVTIYQLSNFTKGEELTSLYSLMAFSLISATLSVGASGVASSDGTVDVDAALIEIGEVRAVNAVDRSAVSCVKERRIFVIYLW